ncbi:MAG: PASTA domain-containing protein [Methyloglobulus sp.]|nr:PASTA domain-containing protein [Methyloglobulus sp.]
MNKYQPRSGLAFKHACFYLNLLLLLFSFCWSTQPLAATNAIRAGFNANTLDPNDNNWDTPIPLGFDIDFYGWPFSSGYISNDGFMTFNWPMRSLTPCLVCNETILMAPFLADVDATLPGSGSVTYGQSTVGSRPAFGVNWNHVGCINTPNFDTGFNSFQMVLIDRSDIGAGDFDIEYNYDIISWDAGAAQFGDEFCQGQGMFNNASVGYISYGRDLQFVGSGAAGSFIDSNLNTGLIHNSRNSILPGRYIFEIRNGLVTTGSGSISGSIYGDNTSNPLADSLVVICNTAIADLPCNLARTNPAGNFLIDGLANGSYSIKAYPPAATNYQTGTLGTVNLAGVNLNGKDITLKSPQPLPGNASVSPNLGVTSAGLPIVYWQDVLTFNAQACAGGTASYTLTNEIGNVVKSGSMNETSPGNYSISVAPLYPQYGQFLVTLAVNNCPGGSSNVIEFNMYIDPSGMVKNQFGQPVSNTTVTLYRSDSSAGPFTIVPNGSAIMSPTNRTNPDNTKAQGLFGWDVVTGYYIVRAAAPGCTSPTVANQAFVETPIMSIPPEVTGLQLVLECPVPVPNVVGQTQTAAQAALTAGNLVVGGITTAPSDMVAAGLVISQNPAAGASVAQNTPVDLVVSSGPPPVVVPGVVGQTQTAAQAALTAANLTVGTVTTASSDTIAAGLVISQNPAAGASVAKSTPVALVVSSGSALVAVPNVVGQTQVAAQTALTAANLAVGTVTTAPSSTVPAGSVISQNPAAGTSVAKASAVGLVVSSGPVVVGNTPYAQFTSKVAAVNREIGTIGSLVLAPTSNGINPLTEVITLKIGSLVKTIPAGTLRYSAASKTYSFTGTIGGNKMVILITQTAAKTFIYSFAISGINPSSFPKGSKVDVSLTIGNDTGTALQVLI